MSSLTNWTFNSLVPSGFPATVLPNVEFWNVSNGINPEYQIQVSWPLEWASRDVESTALTMYVLDGNVLGATATEAIRRRKPVEPSQPDSIIVSIGYPLTDTVYIPQRSIDFQPPIYEGSKPPESPDPLPKSGADDFIQFIDTVLRPWVHSTLFPKVNFARDALYGHSFGGLFVIHTLITQPELFDTFHSASPALFWNGGYMLEQLGRLEDVPIKGTKPALTIGYGSLEQFPVQRRTETDEAFKERRDLIRTFKIKDNCKMLYKRLKKSEKLRAVELKEYKGQDHAGAGASALMDGYEFFIDW
ncbi:hypothetical protein AJ79_02991 [Helicocarpus griseus UAMH5409]|uniref:Esterase n=1 Tax=Helicocarpus griseus UAMH5409 TaxID=1447875 RepID=A0A2B7Y119_9EURO|nr:hypothetical protein AJ79_02991 [Helicocarpus griseus UAMH5409]